MSLAISQQEKKTIWGYIISLSNILIDLRSPNKQPESIQDIRVKIKGLLKEIHEFLIQRTAERNAYFVLFALVAHTDENMQLHIQNDPTQSWISLQNELFGITDAGTLFYGYLDYFRGRNDIPLIIYEVFYFCLKDGFKGSKILEPEVSAAYTEELKAHIPIEELPSTSDRIRNKKQSKARIPPYIYYLVALILILIFRFLLELFPFEISV